MKAVLFDLDGTLLDIDIEPFLSDYFAVLGPVIAEILGDGDPSAGLAAVIRGTEAMSSPHPGLHNEQVFNRAFEEATGFDLSQPSAAEKIEGFYTRTFPTLRGGRGPRPGARDAVETARRAGLRVALATNPIFPRAAIAERARWAGFELDEFDHVTSYENATATKPHADYFLEVAEELGVEPADCLMVGDDPVLDQGGAAAGMSFFYVGAAAPVTAAWNGDVRSVARLLASLRETR